MGFDAKHYARADDELQRRRSANLLESEARRKEIERRFPEYIELRRKLASTGSKIASAVLVSDKSEVRKKIAEIEAENFLITEKIGELLAKGGYPKNYLDIIYSCKKCGDTGIDGNVRCECYKNAVKRSAEDGINSRSNLTLTGFDSFDLNLYPDKTEGGRNVRNAMKKIFSVCKTYAEDFMLPNAGLLLIGNPGLGKTHLSLALAGKVLDLGHSVIYGSAPDLFRKIEDEHFGRAKNSENTAETLQSVDLLILDDVGAEFQNQFYVSVFYNLLNSRMNNGLPLIISSNLDMKELEERYGERIVSRFMTMQILKFCGNDIRYARLKEKLLNK